MEENMMVLVQHVPVLVWTQHDSELLCALCKSNRYSVVQLQQHEGQTSRKLFTVFIFGFSHVEDTRAVSS